ncbi:MAG: hypothetical protein AAF957_11080 [Planctomycetota bacterium]
MAETHDPDPKMKLHAALLLSLAPAAAAQSFNIDVGMNIDLFAGLPDPVYGAASGQSGEWNALFPTFTPIAIAGLDGVTTSVTVRSDATSTFNVFPGVMVPGDDQKLMEDFHLTPNLNMPSTWTFEGLADGDYTVFTYASDPSLPSARIEISVMGSTSPPQGVGAGWPGAHALGQTYAEHDVRVSGGTLVVVGLVIGSQLDSGIINGFQIVQRSDASLGTNYCAAIANSTGVPAMMTGAGSNAVAQNDVTLTCVDLPTNSFGFFLTSLTQGLIVNPGGSSGNLCLGGQIGRYVGPGQIQNSGAAGEISLTLDLTQHPTPTGFVMVQPGDTWNFTAWYRDTAPAGATSNFGDGYEIVFF